MNKFETPILFVVFNRPDTTLQVFQAIRAVKPSRLYVAADGPRDNNQEDFINCKKVRSILENVDWPCEVKTLFREKNLGCKLGVSSAIDWFFENVEEGIVLEDDCVPEISFFIFCLQMLERYRHSKEVMHISGANFQFGKKWGTATYFFSRYPHIWGWATWRRAWRKYDVNIKSFPEFKARDGLKDVFLDSEQRRTWYRILEKVYKNLVDTWDHQWSYALWYNSGISISPNVNLISNIGFGDKATHTKETNILSKIPTESINVFFHPDSMVLYPEADKRVFRKVFWVPLFKKILARVKFLSI